MSERRVPEKTGRSFCIGNDPSRDPFGNPSASPSASLGTWLGTWPGQAMRHPTALQAARWGPREGADK
ncbi:MAG: hypothetical protein IH935_08310 [Acidobacteria bacterium]|nr:hypothetical protein [Acidobacteriota bacterium]